MKSISAPTIGAFLLVAVSGCYSGLGFASENSGGAGAEDGDGGEGADGDVQELCGERPGAGKSTLRRLSREQYNNAIRDLLGFEDNPAGALAADERVGPFYSNSIAPVTELQVEQYMALASTLATRAVEDIDGLLGCDTATQGEDACASEFIARFGRRAFRRPLTDEEQQSYDAMFQVGREELGFADGISLVIESMLQSPNFLYLVEAGDLEASDGEVAPLTGYELATRLSFFLWNGPPDDELLDVAPELSDTDVLRDQAERLLDDPRSQAALASFHLQWLGLHNIESVYKDTGTFPQFDAELVAAMRAEVERFSKHVIVEDDGRLETLFTAPYTFLEGPLFEIYGLEQPADHDPATPVMLDPTQRAGLLTQAGFLTAHSHAVQTSPVPRGVILRRNFLCQDLAPPPADVNDELPELEPGQSTRERFEKHVSDPSCAGCHVLIDGLGFGLEHYDAIGRFRTEDQAGPVDASGDLFGTDVDGAYYGGIELGQKLAQSEQVRQCVMEQWFRFGFGRSIDSEGDACSMEKAYEAFSASDYNIRELIVALVETPSFRYVRIDG